MEMSDHPSLSLRVSDLEVCDGQGSGLLDGLNELVVKTSRSRLSTITSRTISIPTTPS